MNELDSSLTRENSSAQVGWNHLPLSNVLISAQGPQNLGTGWPSASCTSVRAETAGSISERRARRRLCLYHIEKSAGHSQSCSQSGMNPFIRCLVAAGVRIGSRTLCAQAIASWLDFFFLANMIVNLIIKNLPENL